MFLLMDIQENENKSEIKKISIIGILNLKKLYKNI